MKSSPVKTGRKGNMYKPKNELIYSAAEAVGFLQGIAPYLDERREEAAVLLANRLKIAIDEVVDEDNHA